MPADQFFSYATLFGFLFTLARVSCVFAFLPLAAFRGAADTPKIFLSLGFALILWPEWKGPVSAEPGDRANRCRPGGGKRQWDSRLV